MIARHVQVVIGCVALAIVWTLPLALHLQTHLPGPAIGDNAIFLWDFWWMRQALASHANFFHTPYLFAPVGANLTLHTHTALPAFVGATVLGGLSPVAALNVVTVTALALNGFCAYLLAWRTTRDIGAAVVCGVAFGCSPFVAAHLSGHFNLTHAWTIPLFALAWLEALRGRRGRWAVAAGAILAATANVDYYFLVYDIAFAFCALLTERRWIVRRDHNNAVRWLMLALALLVAVDLAVIAAIWVTGGFTVCIGSTVIAAHSLFNPLQLLGVLVVTMTCLYVMLAFRTIDGSARPDGIVRPIVLLVASFSVAVAPLAWEVVRTVENGEYVSQVYYWRSAPPGIDAATLLLGNPFHGVWGSAVRAVYAWLRIDPLESVAWPGVVPAVLAVYAVGRRRHDPVVRRWVAIGVFFLVWAFGSHLFVAGRNTALLMPGAVLQFVPIVANARMPGRAMAVVYLAIAMLAAVATAEYRTHHRRAMIATLIIAFVLMDFLVAPLPIAPIECSTIYQTLHERLEPGAVAELPIAFGDGFGSYTPANSRMMLACETIHGRPLVGGFMARMSPRVVASYRGDPLLAMWMRLSGAVGWDGVPLDRALAAERLRANAIAFIVLDRANASDALQRSVASLPITRLADDGRRALYLVEK